MNHAPISSSTAQGARARTWSRRLAGRGRTWKLVSAHRRAAPSSSSSDSGTAYTTERCRIEPAYSAATSPGSTGSATDGGSPASAPRIKIGEGTPPPATCS